MIRHTPGNWAIKEWETYDHDGSLLSCGYEVVAHVNGKDVRISTCTIEDEDIADLELIAAAPQLLAALKRIAEYPETSQQELGIEAIKSIARVAIEKVEGGDE